MRWRTRADSGISVRLLRRPAAIHSQDTPCDERIFQKRDACLRCFGGSADASDWMYTERSVSILDYSLREGAVSGPARLALGPECS